MSRADLCSLETFISTMNSVAAQVRQLMIDYVAISRYVVSVVMYRQRVCDTFSK